MRTFLQVCVFLALISVSAVTCAAAESSFERRWGICLAAIGDGEIEMFRGSFGADLLSRYIFLRSFDPVTPGVRPCHLGHLALLSSHSSAGAILEHMLQNGLNPNRIETFEHQEIVMNQESISGFRGKIASFYLLDLAVLLAKPDKVELLLRYDADPFQTTFLPRTSLIQLLLKTFVSSKFGETPLEHAQTSLEFVHDQNNALSVIPNDAAERLERIIELLRNKQEEQNLSLIDRSCSLL